jgi:hypothetical protein
MRKTKPDYREAPPNILAALDASRPSSLTLPPPEELLLKEETVKVTLTLNRQSVRKLKAFAHQHGGKYQNMIRKLIDYYAAQSLSSK